MKECGERCDYEKVERSVKKRVLAGNDEVVVCGATSDCLDKVKGCHVKHGAKGVVRREVS